MSAPAEPADPAVSPPFTQSREFWVLMGYAVVLGVFGAFAGLVFMGVIGFGGRWYVDANPHNIASRGIAPFLCSVTLQPSLCP